MKCLVCGGTHFIRSFTVSRPDPYRALISPDAPPARYHECATCEAMIFEGDAAVEQVYDGGSYYGIDGDPIEFLTRRFNQIASLPPERSDNQARITRIRRYLEASIPLDASQHPRKVADVGAGMGIFLHGFVDLGWKGIAIEPDPYACNFMRSTLPHLEVIEGYSGKAEHSSLYDLITLNRVLEHVSDPSTLLKDEASRLTEEGIIYVEVPDTQSFFLDGPDNEAFGYTHFVIYSPLTLTMLVREMPLEVVHLNRVQEPSGKFTLYGFLKRRRMCVG